MVPRPESNNTFVAAVFTSIAQLLRFKDGTQVPDPKIVTVHALLRRSWFTVDLGT